MRRPPLLPTVLLLSALAVYPTPARAGDPTPRTEARRAAAQELTEAAVKRYVTSKEEALATGVGSAPKSVQVTVGSVRFGQRRAATERDRVVNGITGKTVYPVRVQYTALRRWGNGETETKAVHSAYEFYQDEYGEWSAYHVGPVR